MKKRLLSALLALSVLMGSMPVYALEDTEPAAAVAAQTATPETADPVETTPTPDTQSEATPTPEAEMEARSAPARAQEEQNAPEQEDAQPRTIYEEKTVFGVGADLPDNDELFALYLQQQMYPDRVPSTMANWGAAEGTLNEWELAIYNTLKDFVSKVARGEVEPEGSNGISTKEIQVPGELSWTFDELGVSDANDPELGSKAYNALGREINFTKIVECLMVDCPAEFYWFNKGEGGGFNWGLSILTSPMTTTVTVSGLNMTFGVAQEYMGSDIYHVDANKTGAASAAIANAKAIADSCASLGDYDKLVAFKDAICNLTSYNTEAASDLDTPYGNPWQLIYVFDENPATTVVCEGYAKAFQYLCDLGGLTCYTVTGTMSGSAHMWNIVKLDGKNYLVDVTNCDENTVGYPNELFLAGTTGSPQEVYTFQLSHSEAISYDYDQQTEELYSESVLTLEDSRYTPGLTITGMPESVRYGDSFQLQTEGTVGAIQWSVQGTSATVDQDGNVTVTGVEPFTVTASDTESGKQETASFTPQKVLLTVSAATVADRSYDRTTRVNVEAVTLQGIIGSDDVSVNLAKVLGDLPSANAGTYNTVTLSNLTLQGADSDKYTLDSTAQVSVQVTITPAPSTLNKAPQAATGLTYTGEPQVLVTEGTAEGGTLQYALSENGTYSEELPTATNADTYTVWYKVVGDGNHTDTQAEQLSVSIAKAVPEAPERLFTTYSHGAILSSVELPEGWKWVNPSELLGNVGQREFTAKHPGDGNYEPGEATVQVYIGLADCSLADVRVAQSTLTYNGTQQSLTGIQLLLEGYVLQEGIDYTVEDPGGTQAGSYVATLRGRGNYQGMIQYQYYILPKPVMAQVVAENKVYDGTTDAVVSAVVETGVSGESLTITGLQGSFAQKDAGKNLTVTVDFSAAQGNNDNYKITFPETTTASITPAEYSYAGVADQEARIGNGLDTINASATAAGVAGELVDGAITWYEDESHTTALPADYRFAGEAGDTVTLYWVFTPAADETNYTTQPAAGSTVFTLTEKLVPQLDVQGLTKVYDGKAVTLSNLSHKADVAGTWSFAKDTPELKNAGEYDVEVCFTPLDSIAYAQTSTVVKVKIEKRPIVVELQLSATQIMPADALPTASLVYHGVVDGENIAPSLQPVITGLPEKAEPGLYAVQLSNRDEMKKAIEETETGKNYTVDFIDMVVLTVGDIIFANDVQEGIQEIPQSLQEVGLADETAILEKMVEQATEKAAEITKESTTLYDVTLQYSEDGGKTWKEASEEDFPQEGITVTLPYPDGTNAADFDFVVTHMLTVARNGYQPGDVETPAVTKTDKGLQFTVHSLSPIAVSWTAVETEPEETATAGTDSGSSPAATPAPQTVPASGSTPYYTCPACGYHDWTATGEGYRCDHCGHLESVKQLSGYGNVKGVYTPQASGGTAAKSAASAIAQTGDDSNPALWSMLCLLSALTLGGLVLYRRKRNR